MRSFTPLFFFLTILMLPLSKVFSQSTFLSNPSGGSWTTAATWTCVGGPCSTTVPTGSDIAVLVGDGAGGGSVSLSSNSSIGDIFIVSDATGVLSKSGFGGKVLTINGQLAGTHPDLSGTPQAPSVDVIQDNTGLTLLFTGANGTNPVITSWSHIATINNVTFDQTGTGTNFQIEDLAVINNMNVTDGTVTIMSGFDVIDGGTATISVASGASFVVNGGVNGDGTTSSLFTTVNINGDATTGAVGYINASAFTLGSGASLTVNFNGANQTQGWWFGSNSPGTAPIDLTSTITYNASANQNIGALTYGNLVLRSPLSASNKTLQSTNTLAVAGNLTINSANVTFITSGNANPIQLEGNLINNGTWSPTQLVRFDGTTAQSISGNNAVTFGGGLRAENTTAAVSLSNQSVDINGELDIDLSATFNPANNNVSLFGNLQNDGTLTAGTVNSTFTFDGATAINGTGSHNFNFVVISNSLTAPTGTINVARDWTNNGTFNRNIGTVVMNGTVAQSITGSASTAFNNLTTSNASGVGVNANVDLYGTYTLSSGTFDADGAGLGIFTVKSTSLTADARIATLSTPANFSGNVTVERFIDGTVGGDWRYIASPITNGNLGMWSDDFPVTGSFSGLPPNGANNVIDNTAPSVARYDAIGINNYVYLSASGGAYSTVALTNGAGYSAYTFLDADHTVSIRGTIGKNNKNVPISTASGRFNLVGNPYPSTINGNTLLDNNPNVGQTFYIRTSNGVYASYNAFANTGTGGPVGWAGEIFMGQSFWVVSSTASTLNFTESLKIPNGNGQFLKTSNDPLGTLRVKLSNTTQKDETLIIFNDNATAGFELSHDAYKYPNGYTDLNSVYHPYLNISSFNDAAPSTQYVFNTLPAIDCNINVSLKMTNVPVGTYNLDFTGLANFGLPYNIKLVDNFTATQVVLSEGTHYEFEVTADVASSNTARFDIVFDIDPLDVNNEPSYIANNTCSSNYVNVDLSGLQTGIDYILLSSGVPVDSIRATTSTGYMKIAKSTLVAGNNTYSIKAKNSIACSASETIFNDLVVVAYNEIAEIQTVQNAEACIGTQATLTASGVPANGSYKWYTSMDAIDNIAGAFGSSYTIDNVQNNVDYFVAAVNESGCEGGRVKVTASVKSLNTPTVQGVSICSNTNANLVASGAGTGEYYKWYETIDAIDPISGVSGSVLTLNNVNSSNAYYVSIANNDGCESSKEIVEVIVYSLEIPSIIVAGNSMSVSGGDTYQWYKDGEIIAGAIDNSYEVVNSGSYYVEITKDGCTAASVAKDFVITGIDNVLYELGLSIYPNPVEDRLNIRNIKTKELIIKLFDSKGQLIFTKDDIKVKGSILYFNTANLLSGIYILNIEEGSRVIPVRILKK
jgi:hypothetical protein